MVSPLVVLEMSFTHTQCTPFFLLLFLVLRFIQGERWVWSTHGSNEQQRAGRIETYKHCRFRMSHPYGEFTKSHLVALQVVKQ